MKSYPQKSVHRNRRFSHRFSALLDALPDVIFHLDDQARFLDVYSEGDGGPCRLHDREVIGRKLEEVFPAPVARRLERAHTEALRHGHLQIVDYSMKREGKEYSFEARVIPAEAKGTPRKSTLVIIRDITADKHSRDYLNLIKKIFEDATEAMLIFSTRDDKVYFNESFCQMFGLGCDEEPGKRLEDLERFFAPEQFSIFKEMIRRNGSYHGEVTVLRPDGSRLSAWLNYDTLEDGEKGDEAYEIAILTDISELQESREMLRFTATHDGLTGLPNRRMLLNHLEQAVRRSVRNHRSGAVFFIDLDNFKYINDSLGHIAGDAVLIECASRIRSAIRKSDIFGRLGGDEFLLITEEIKSPDDLMHLASKIIAVVNEPFYVGDLKHNIGASIGVAIFPNDSTNRDELLQFADMAMYQAKEKGKNRYQFYSSSLDRKVKRHFLIEKALRYALENDGFYLVFQPQIDLSTNVLTGLEALIRIDERIAGPLHPQEFIPIAEESDLILKIGRWVFQRCCQTIFQWNREYHLGNVEISINLSRRQLMDESWPGFVEETLKKYHLDPTKIEFEITETAFMQSQKTGSRTIEMLQKIGCKISIDDFGTGYSSLATLRKFTVDKLKIDKSFIDEISHNSTDRSIVKASIAMANAMGLKTVAEGVETDEQKKVVKLMGCKEMQGFLYSEPKRAAEILRLLKEMNGKKGEK